jgi:hypothetical protein
MNLNPILNIDPSKECLKFLVKRIHNDNYRGMQVSQHNRYTYEQVVGMLSILYEISGNEKMQIRTTDLSKRPHNTQGEERYALYTTKVNEKYGKSTQDSIRKNLFVDFHRMGLIDRYTKNNEKILPNEFKPIKFVSISEIGKELIDLSKNEFQRYLIFTRALDYLLKGFASDLIEIVAEFGFITLIEFTFFVSFLYKEIDEKIYLKDDIIKFLKEYRSLSRFQKQSVENIIRNECDPHKFNGDKKAKRDFHNWINEAQQIFMILGMTVYYENDRVSGKLNLRVDEGSLFHDTSKLKRSLAEKHLYFNNHQISKTLGFELHHIVPLSWAKSKEDFFVLDKWQNMVYIDGFSHARITQSNNENVIIKFREYNNDVLFIDFKDKYLECIYGINIKYKTDLKNLMIEKNKALLHS